MLNGKTIESPVKPVFLTLFFLEDNAKLAFQTVKPMLLMHSFALNAQLDSELMEDNALLLILIAQDTSFKIYLKYANPAFQDITYHKEFAQRIKLAASTPAQFAQVVSADSPTTHLQRLALFTDVLATQLMDVLLANLHLLSRITPVLSITALLIAVKDAQLALMDLWYQMDSVFLRILTVLSLQEISAVNASQDLLF